MDAHCLAAPQADLLIEPGLEATIVGFSDDAYGRFRSAKLFAEGALGLLLRTLTTLPAFYVTFDDMCLLIAFCHDSERFFIGGCFDLRDSPEWPTPPGGGRPTIIIVNLLLRAAGVALQSLEREINIGELRILNANTTSNIVYEKITVPSSVGALGDVIVVSTPSRILDDVRAFGRVRYEIGDALVESSLCLSASVSDVTGQATHVKSGGSILYGISDIIRRSRLITTSGFSARIWVCGADVKTLAVDTLDGRCSLVSSYPHQKETLIERRRINFYAALFAGVLGPLDAVDGDGATAGGLGQCSPVSTSTGDRIGVGAVTPGLLDYPGSAFVLDVNAEHYMCTAHARRTAGQAVILVDPFNIVGTATHGLNWLDTPNSDDPDVINRAARLADILVSTEGADWESHWDAAARDLLRGLLLYVGSLSGERRSMAELRRIVTASEGDLANTLADMLAEPERGQQIPARAAEAHLSRSERERGLVWSTVVRHTAWLDDPRLWATLSRSDFSLRDLQRRPMTVYLAIPPDHLRACAGFVRGFVGLALDGIAATRPWSDHRVAFFLDEYAELDRIDHLADGATLSRDCGAQLSVFARDHSQFKAGHPRWQSHASVLGSDRMLSTILGSPSGSMITHRNFQSCAGANATLERGPP